MEKQQKIIEELHSIELFAEKLLEKCSSVRELLSLGGFHPRATIKKKSQSKINQVIENRNKSMKRKCADIKHLIIFLFFFGSASAQSFSLPSMDSLCTYIDDYFEDLTESQIEEYKSSNKKRWLNYVPSPGYSPFTGGFSFSLNIAAPLQEIKNNHQAKQKIQSIIRLNQIQSKALKNEVFADFNSLENAINEFHSRDTLVQLKHKAFHLAETQYQRNEITPTEFLAKQYEIEALTIQRITEANSIYKSILSLLIKSKKPVLIHAPAN